MNVGRIRELCKERGTNFKQLEIVLGFGNGAISRWGDSPPAVTKVKAVADYFGVTVDDLLAESGRQSAVSTTEGGTDNAED